MTSNRKRALLIVGILTTIIFFILVLVYRDAIRENVVIPAYFAVWLVRQVVYSIPQILCLFGLGILSLGMAVYALRGLARPVKLPTDPPPPIEEPTRYRFWKRRFRSFGSSAFFLSSLGIELRRLFLSIIAYQEHCDMWDLERQIVNGEYEVPPDIQDFIAKRELGTVSGEWSIWDSLRRLFRGRSADDVYLQNRLDKILTYLENRLEVQSDRTDS